MTPRTVHTILGMPGTGKTFYACHRVRSLLSELHNNKESGLVLIHDTRCRQGAGWYDGTAVGLLAPIHARFENVDSFKAACNGSYPAYVCSFWGCEPQHVAELALERQRQGLLTILVVDELDLIGQRIQTYDPIYHCLNFGRSGPTHIIGTAREPARIEPGFLTLATHVTLFRLQWDLVLQRIASSGWSNAREIHSMLPHLQPHNFLTIETGV